MFLGIDTSTRWLNLALLSRQGELRAEFRESLPTHTTRLAPEIRKLLSGGGAGPQDLAALGVVLGPGSFTGLRVGLAAASGLAQALEIPSYGLSSLEALARACPSDGLGVALLDARRGEVYCQRFLRAANDVLPQGDPAALAPTSVDMDGLSWAMGDGVPLVPDWPATCHLHPEVPNLALEAAANARSRDFAGEAPAPLRALYVRAPDVRTPGIEAPRRDPRVTS
jgi:tRNA threonylcarbamoyladenosine biosynthesis protein TsaB